MESRSGAQSSGAAPAFPLGYFLAPAAAALLALVFCVFLRAGGALTFPYQLDREEGYLFNQALRLSQGETIYPALTDYPYTVGNYPPVYPGLYALALWLAGAVWKSPAEWLEGGLGVGRGINLLAAMGIFAGLVWWIRSRTRRWVPALLAPALFAATYDFNEWIAYARVDMLALAISFWGWLLFLRNPTRGGFRPDALLMALALFTRQTLLAVPLAACIALLWEYRRKGLIPFLAQFLLYSAGLFGALFLFTGGRAWSHLVTFNANPFNWRQVGWWMRHLFLFQRFTIVCAILIPPLLLFAKHGERWRRESAGLRAAKTGGEGEMWWNAESRMTFTYFILAFATVLMTGKEGAAPNYLLEFHLATALFLGLQVGRLDDKMARRDEKAGEEEDAAENQACAETQSAAESEANAEPQAVPGAAESEADAETHAAARKSRFAPHPARGLLRGLVFLLLSFHAVYAWLHSGILLSKRPPGDLDSLAASEILDTLAPLALHKGEILADDAIYPLLLRRPVLFQPFIMSELARQGLWSERRFVEDLRRARFGAVAVSQDFFDENQFFWAWTPAMREAIRQSYKPYKRLNFGPAWRYWIYVPNTSPQ